jgi:DNA-binding MarR family transcriptional regulator
MKKKSDSKEVLVKLFGSISRARILGFLYAFPGASFYQREIMYETGLTLRAIQRELANLSALGIVKRQKTHNRVYYEMNSESPFFKSLRDIFA